MIRLHLSTSLIAKMMTFFLLAVQGILSARLLGPQAKGALSFFQADLNLFVLFLGFGIRSAAVYFVSSKKMEVDKVFGICLLFLVQSLVLLSILISAVWFVPKIDFLFPDGFRSLTCLLYLVGSYFFGYINSMFNAILSGKVRFVEINAVDVCVAILRVSLFGTLYLISDKTKLFPFELLLMIDLSLTALGSIAMTSLFIVKEGTWPNFKITFSEIYKPFVGFSFLLYISSLINFAYSRVDFWIIEKLQGLADLGIYAVAVHGAQALTFVPTTIAITIYPHLASQNKEEADRTFRTFSRINFTLTLLIAIFLFALGDFLIPKLFGAPYADSVMPFRILVWGYLVLSTKHLFLIYFQVIGLLKVNIKAEIIAFFLSVTLNILFAPKYGVVGVSVVMVTANLVAFFIVFSKRPSPSPIRQYFLMTKADLHKVFGKFLPK